MWHDFHGVALGCNAAAERMLGPLHGWRLGMAGRAVRENGLIYAEADHPVRVALRTGQTQQAAMMGWRRPGMDLTWMLAAAHPLTQDGDVTPYGAVMSLVDVTVLKQMEQQLRHEALHDALTCLCTRNLLYDRLENSAARLARNSDNHFALIFVDLDGFKAANDALGHAAGDTVLVATAERLKGCVRSHDTVARLGGDEFAVLLEGLPQVDAAVGFAERIVQVLGDLLPTDQRPRVSASVGVVLATPGQSPPELLRQADAAMYRAKAAGRARYYIAP